MNQIKSVLSLIFLFSSLILIGQSRNFNDFSGIKVSGNLKVELVNSDQNMVEIEMIKGDIENIITEVKGDVLHLKVKQKWGWGNKTKASIVLYHDGVNQIDASAGATLKSVDHINSTELDIDVSSGATAKVAVECSKLKVNVSSGATAKLSGHCKEQYIDVSSGATYKATSLASDNVDVDASSGASAKVWATKSITANASSGGSIKYKGEPENTKLDAGKYSGGSIRKM